MGNDARDEDVHAVDEHLTDDLLGDVEQPTDGESLTEGELYNAHHIRHGRRGFSLYRLYNSDAMTSTPMRAWTTCSTVSGYVHAELRIRTSAVGPKS